MALQTRRARVLAVGAVVGVAAAMTVGLSAPSGATSAASQSRGGDQARLDRAFIIVLENHSQHSVIGDPNSPYITSLAQQYGEAANYFGVTHPSEPNYIAMISGSNWYTNNDNPANRFDHTNLVDELDANHISWGAYMEAMPASTRSPTSGRPAPIRCTRPSTTRSRCSPTSAATRPGWRASSPTPPWRPTRTARARPGSCSSRQTSATTCTAGCTTRSADIPRPPARSAGPTTTRTTSGSSTTPTPSSRAR